MRWKAAASVAIIGIAFQLAHAEPPRQNADSRLRSKDQIESTIETGGTGNVPLELVEAYPLPEDDESAWLFVTLHRSTANPEGWMPKDDVLRFWEKQDGKYRLVRELRTSGAGVPIHYDRAQTFQALGRQFVFVPCEQEGTGHVRCDQAYVVTSKRTLEEIDFRHAPELYQDKLKPGEGVWKGEINDVAPEGMTFEFYIWKEGDGNCCPSAGRVTGAYHVVRTSTGGEDRYAIVPYQFKRGPAAEARR